MKIALVLPPLPFLDDPLRNAPLGPLYVTAALKEAGAKVVVLDQRDGDAVVRKDADAYAWTATTLEYPAAVKSARQVKDRYPSAVRVLGGVHASVVPPAEIDPVFDIIVPGEGEPMAEPLMIAIDAHVGVRVVGLPGRISDVDAVPWPAREALRRHRWISHSLVQSGVPSTTIIASRGCPYHCAFCAAPTLYGRRVRWRSVAKVAEEVDYLVREHGIKGLRFHDDCFGIERQRLTDMCQMLSSMGVIYRVNVRATAMDHEAAFLLWSSGCVEVGIGVESAHQPSLDLMEKGLSVEAAEEAIRVCKAAGLRVRVFMMIGLPGEGRDISDKTIAFLEQTRPDKVVLSSFVPFPGTRVHDHPEQFGIKYVDADISRHRMFVGLGEDEPFRFGYAEMTAGELEFHRGRILYWLRRWGMA